MAAAMPSGVIYVAQFGGELHGVFRVHVLVVELEDAELTIIAVLLAEFLLEFVVGQLELKSPRPGSPEAQSDDFHEESEDVEDGSDDAIDLRRLSLMLPGDDIGVRGRGPNARSSISF